MSKPVREMPDYKPGFDVTLICRIMEEILMNKKLFTFLLLFVMMFVTACSMDDLFDNKENNGVKASTTMVELNTFYNLSDNEAVVVSGLYELPDRAKNINGKWYLNINSVTGIDNHFYWNQAEEQMIVTTADSIDYYWPDVNNCTINGSGVELESSMITLDNGTLYVSLELLEKYSPVMYSVYDNPDRIVIRTNGEQYDAYKTTIADVPVRTGAAVTNDIIVKLQEGSSVYVTGEQSGDFLPVITEDGFAGYIAADSAESDGTVTITTETNVKEYTHNLLETEYFTAVWHNMVYSADGSLIKSELDGSEGVDVIIPTWYRVIDTAGNISSNANRSYVTTAHNMGMEVWGLVDDFAEGVPGIEVLSSTVARNNLADSLVASALEYELDGINVDFEYITYESSVHYIQFLRELYLKMKPHGLKLSVDNYVPDSANAYYNLKAQEEVADYIILMTYDEHYSPSVGTGSVASIGFVENGVAAALEDVPANRLVMGIPFYTRLWETDSAGTVTMQVLTMKNMTDTVEHYGINPVWDEEAGQYYVQYTNSEGLTCEMWLEEETSIAKKREVCNNYDLAGTASWCLGYEPDEVWKFLK